MPRYGSTGLVSSNNNEIYIFGGILSNEEDYLMMNSGIFLINIYNKINYKAYNIREIPKKETKIRPKMHYKI